MIQIGRYNTLRVSQIDDNGITLDAKEHGSLFIPYKQAPQGFRVGSRAKVFLYQDARGRLAGTTREAKAKINDFACLAVVGTSSAGAFLDWGLPKDLFLPEKEQTRPVRKDQKVLVYVYEDDNGKAAASSKLNKFVNQEPTDYRGNQEVELIIADETDIGTMAIINGQHWGLIHQKDIFKPLRLGQRMKGYIKKIREDGKIDLSLQAKGYEKVGDISEKIVDHLIAHDGFVAMTDKSPPEVIYNAFGISKRAFKMAIGTLYKNQLVRIEQDGIYLVHKD